MTLLLAPLAMLLTVMLGIAFSGLGNRIALNRSRDETGHTHRATFPVPEGWEVMKLDPAGMLPWPSEASSSGEAAYGPLPWPSTLWPEPFCHPQDVTRAMATTHDHGVAHQAPSAPPSQVSPEDAFFEQRPSTTPKQGRKQVKRPKTAKSRPSAAPESQSVVTPDTVRSWVGMYGLAGAVDRYRKQRGIDFTVAAKEIAEILRS